MTHIHSRLRFRYVDEPRQRTGANSPSRSALANPQSSSLITSTTLVGNFSLGDKSFTDLTDVSKALLDERYLSDDLEQLDLDFSYCPALSDVSALGPTLASMPALKHLKLDFSCSLLSDVSAFGASLANQRALNSSALGVRRLEHLELRFSECPVLSDLSAIGTSLASLTALKHLKLDFSSCHNLSDVSAIGASLGSLKKLRHLGLYFSECAQLSVLSGFGASLSLLRSLQQLYLDFSYCPQLCDVAAIGVSLASLTALQHVELNFTCCTQIADLSEISASLASMKTRKLKLQLYFEGCHLLPINLQMPFKSRQGFLRSWNTWNKEMSCREATVTGLERASTY